MLAILSSHTGKAIKEVSRPRRSAGDRLADLILEKNPGKTASQVSIWKLTKDLADSLSISQEFAVEEAQRVLMADLLTKTKRSQALIQQPSREQLSRNLSKIINALLVLQDFMDPPFV